MDQSGHSKRYWSSVANMLRAGLDNTTLLNYGVESGLQTQFRFTKLNVDFTKPTREATRTRLKGMLREYREKLRALIEAVGASAEAPVLRRVVQAYDKGEGEDGDPIASFRDDRARKERLKQVMPLPGEKSDERDEERRLHQQLDEARGQCVDATEHESLFDDDDDSTCYDSDGEPCSCDSDDAVYGPDGEPLDEADAEPKQRPSDQGARDASGTVARVAEGGYGMGESFTNRPSTPSDAVYDAKKKPLDKWENGDPNLSREYVRYRYSEDESRSCGTCSHRKGEGYCEVLGGLIRKIDTCDAWSSDASEAIEAFRQKYEKR